MSYTLTDEQKERVKNWYASTMYAFEDFKSFLKDIEGGAVMMQPNLLYCVIVSWVIDEDRYIEFHKCKNGLELHKTAAFFLYWFSRLKPIQILSVGDGSNQQLVLINEIFALLGVCKMLNIEGSKVMPEKFFKEIVYILRYRKFTAESIFPTIRLMDVAAKNNVLMQYDQ
jgi:hypothetical protein